MMEEKLESVSIAAYRGREFYGEYSKLTISMIVSVKCMGVNVFKIMNFGPIREQRNLTFDQSGIVKILRGDELEAYEFWKT